MKYAFLSIVLLWIFIGQSQATLESCQALGLYFCSECVDATTQCTSCAPGYTMNSTNTGCIPCSQVANCDSCTIASGVVTCTACKAGYLLEGNACYNCGGCTTCRWNTTYSTVECACSVDGDTPDTTDGYYEFRGYCTSSDDYACNSGYVYVEEDAVTGVPSCLPCPVGCIHCNKTISCRDCGSTGYATMMTSDGTCFDCSTLSSSCAACSSSDGETYTCDACSTGYLTNGVCTACPANCDTCSTSSTGVICNTCSSGYYLDTATVCQPCPANCDTCSISSTGVICNTCSSGYYLDTATVCQSAKLLSQGCINGSVVEKSCTTCQTGVGAMLDSGKCKINCYQCGNLTNGVPTTSVDKCDAQGNVYSEQNLCEYGCSITVKYENGQMVYAARGCVVDATCLSDGVEQCSGDVANQTCTKCCDSVALCNGDFWDPSSAPTSHVFSVAMLLVTLLTAYVID